MQLSSTVHFFSIFSSWFIYCAVIEILGDDDALLCCAHVMLCLTSKIPCSADTIFCSLVGDVCRDGHVSQLLLSMLKYLFDNKNYIIKISV